MRHILAIFLVCFSMATVQAQEKALTLVSDPVLMERGLWKYVLPRFKLKTRIKVNVVSGQGISGDVRVFSGGDAPFIEGGGAEYSVVQLSSNADADKFMEWLASDIGLRTISAFEIEDQQVFFPMQEEVVVVDAPLIGNTSKGEVVALSKCGRCHVVSEQNKYGGIDSTPSFAALRSLSDWQEKFGTFWTLRPHPSFTQIEDMTPPFDPAHPPIIYPIYLTLDEVSDIGAYLQTIEPKDLGPPLEGE